MQRNLTADRPGGGPCVPPSSGHAWHMVDSEGLPSGAISAEQRQQKNLAQARVLYPVSDIVDKGVLSSTNTGAASDGEIL